jgi:hypothetical protein
VHFSSKAEYTNNPLKYISYCHNCHFPEQEGSVIYALNAKYGQKEYKVTGELIYSVPNQAENPIINNSDYLHNRIVFVDRGKVALLDKILRIQDQSAAIAIVIAEVNGDCDDAFRSCGSSRLGSVREGGFAAYDDEDLWKKVNIPVIMVSAKSADRLRALMHNEPVFIPGLGLQNVTSPVESDARSQQAIDQMRADGWSDHDEYENQFRQEIYDEYGEESRIHDEL